MLFSAVGNLVLVGLVDVETWALVLMVWGIASKLSLFLVQFTFIRLEAGRTARKRRAEAAAAGA